MHPSDSLDKRKKKTEEEFKKFLEEEFEDPENSDILVPKKPKPDKKKPRA